jgi:hypothetical protein
MVEDGGERKRRRKTHAQEGSFNHGWTQIRRGKKRGMGWWGTTGYCFILDVGMGSDFNHG